MERPISYRPLPVSPHKPAEDDSQPGKLCLFCPEPASPAALLCSTCKIPLCASCFSQHISLSRYEAHRSVPYEDCSWCPVHVKRQVLRCTDCEEQCCIICANFGRHKGHRVMDKETESRVAVEAVCREVEGIRGKVVGKLRKSLEEVEKKKREIAEWEEKGCQIITEKALNLRKEAIPIKNVLLAQLELLQSLQFSRTADSMETFKRQIEDFDRNFLETLIKPEDFQLNITPDQPQIRPIPASSPIFGASKPAEPNFDLSLVPAREEQMAIESEEQSYELPAFEDIMESVPEAPSSFLYMLCNDSNKLVQLNMSTDQWEIHTGDRTWPRFCNYTLLDNHTLFATGGGLIPSKTAFSLDLQTFQSCEEPGMLTPRNHHGLVLIPSIGVLAIGGICKSIQVKCELFDLEIRQWQEVSPLNHARAAMGACEHRAEVYVFGGWNGRCEIDSIERFTQCSEWGLLPFGLPQASQCNAVVYESRILVFAFKPGKIYEIEGERLREFGKITNEAWCRPELRLYNSSVYSFRSGESKYVKYYIKEEQFQVVSISLDSGL